MFQKPSMTRKLVVAITSVVAVFWLVAMGFGILIMQDEFSEIFDSGIQETAERLLPIVIDDLAGRDAGDALRRPAEKAASNREYLVYQVRGRDGQILLKSRDAPAEPFPAPLEVGFSQNDTHRIYTAGTADGSFYIQVADSLDNRREAAIEGGMALFFPILALIPASIIAIILVVRMTLSPIEGLRDDIGTKDGGNMVPVDEAGLPVELRPIARSVNLLLDRLRAVLESEREFTANSAHELRTPIAGALAQTQRLLAEVPPSLSARVGQIERSLQHLGRLAEKLLQMSRAEAGIGVSDEKTDLFPVLQVVIEDIGRSALGAGRIVLHAPDEARLERQIRPDAFAIVVRNLLENALVHSPSGSVVDVYFGTDGIRVVNESAVLDQPTLAGLTRRFTRGPTQAAGSGLGLSIVKRFVEQMNGSLALQSPATGRLGGFEAAVRL
ncbi:MULTISPECIES: histidine kinase dimerization/phospho-acceptor domain-containing protein [Ensifer]|uniref:histidine kinase n=1 Tax=Ensifer canadensis TaxID=555315 RepID=A0AAW4FHV0_9HYPH|nr:MULTISPECIES: histidine kinase dimerization/phospho-acceptor domain-containing protein [Ensifer]KQU90705.1 histidine kinase [Ensifer sp. Root31]KQW50622.1 histidine kinase [Ensifer sp. Root1252]KQW67455.1 histidine kinase [Ensifer sp. Root127]KRC74845.1 histidine kinase [Ensifer sp. Root231]KRD03266.1 histidine kinase [Ensifer sp. Root258]